MTQIFGTFGPSCGTGETLEKMFRAGMTGMRLNLSHCNLEDAAEQIEAFHFAAAAVGIQPQLVIDTQGPELRIGAMEPLELQEGAEVTLGKEIPVPEIILEELDTGREVLLDDGKIALEIIDSSKKLAKVIRRGYLKGKKSIKLTGKQIHLPVLTARDIENIKKATQYGVTGLLQPFVHSGEELLELRRILSENNAAHLKVFAKIETQDGAENLEDILPRADVIVIARGDLGNDIPLWKLPAVQKEISDTCCKAGKDFVVVTQMLASMEHAAVPTRAEVNDVFNAVLDGAWGVMLTGETAVGSYPVEAIRYLANTAGEACKWQSER